MDQSARAFPLIGLCWLALTGAPAPTVAHPVLGENVGHRIEVVVGPEYLDIEIALVFFAGASLAERLAMDRDGDGEIVAAETDVYLASLDRVIAKSVMLQVGDEPIEIYRLYSPELDLGGESRVVPFVHRLRLHYFARLPEMSAGALILVTDRFWPQRASVTSVRASGSAGVGVHHEANDWQRELVGAAPLGAQMVWLRYLGPTETLPQRAPVGEGGGRD